MKKLRFQRMVKNFVSSLREDKAPGQITKCHTCQQNLVAKTSGQHLLLGCPTCEGTWIPIASLKAALSDDLENEELLEAVDNDGESDIGNTFAPSRVSRKCPACEQFLENHKFDDSGVWIDSCPEGHGIWLDRGELKLLSQRRKGRSNATESDDGDDTVSDLLLSIL